ncbi:hypothetical protein BJ878DRAFT_549514 [Calycina marina]|uniref:HMG box domain-containing protein n=1 Tax=Calycina marina TaxID=1763456 RepID=A0A9P7Z3P6_9HELO|nr:hypothetical protein BJ878DRAFT_549514 [Calycina marina]
MTTASIPLSPAPSQPGDMLPHGLGHIARHNAGRPYPELYNDEVLLQHHSNYSTPTPGRDEAYGYQGQQPRYAYQQHQQHQQHEQQGSGFGLQYDNFGNNFQDPMYQNYSTPATSPPTAQIHTRSSFAIPRSHLNLKPLPERRAGVERSPKVKKERKTKAKAEKKVAKLDKPLSELTKDWTHVAVADIDSYVNRPAEERHKEVLEGKIPGKIKRPMNSFMLYRKAYQNRTKDWCLQNNHQVVSQVCGDSWPLEPDEVKEQFNEWARIERQNHQNAHPGYKFSPTKPGATKVGSKRKMPENVETDWEWQGPGSRRTKRHRPSPRNQQVAYPTTRSAYNYSSRGTSLEPVQSGYIRSSFHANNSGRPMPAPYDSSSLASGEYYQQSLQAHGPILGVQDVILRKAVAPGVQSLIGLPNGTQGYDDLLHQYPPYDAHFAGDEYKMDRSLTTTQHLAYNGNGFDEGHSEGLYFGGSLSGDPQWHGPCTSAESRPHSSEPGVSQLDPEFENAQFQNQNAQVLRGHQADWHVQSLDEGGQFEQWMDKGT